MRALFDCSKTSAIIIELSETDQPPSSRVSLLPSSSTLSGKRSEPSSFYEKRWPIFKRALWSRSIDLPRRGRPHVNSSAGTGRMRTISDSLPSPWNIWRTCSRSKAITLAPRDLGFEREFAEKATRTRLDVLLTEHLPGNERTALETRAQQCASKKPLPSRSPHSRSRQTVRKRPRHDFDESSIRDDRSFLQKPGHV